MSNVQTNTNQVSYPKFPKSLAKAFTVSAKNLGFALLLMLIFVSISVADAEPTGGEYYVATGETIESSVYVAEIGSEVQWSVGVITVDGENIDYEDEFTDEDDVWDQKDEAYFRVVVLAADNRDFEDAYEVSVMDGMILANQFTATDNFYKFEITNLAEADLSVGFGRTEANLGLVAVAAISIVYFGIAMAIFQLVLHIALFVGFVILVLWLIDYGLPSAEKYMADRYERRNQAYNNQRTN